MPKDLHKPRNKFPKIPHHLYGSTSYFIKKLSPIQMMGDFREFISREPNMFGSWNLVCGGLLAFLISRNFCGPKFLLERCHLESPLFPGYYFLVDFTSASLENTLKLISRQRHNIWVCDFKNGFSLTRPFNRGVVRPNLRNWNKPHCKPLTRCHYECQL